MDKLKAILAECAKCAIFGAWWTAVIFAGAYGIYY